MRNAANRLPVGLKNRHYCDMSTDATSDHAMETTTAAHGLCDRSPLAMRLRPGIDKPTNIPAQRLSDNETTRHDDCYDHETLSIDPNTTRADTYNHQQRADAQSRHLNSDNELTVEHLPEQSHGLSTAPAKYVPEGLGLTMIEENVDGKNLNQNIAMRQSLRDRKMSERGRAYVESTLTAEFNRKVSKWMRDATKYETLIIDCMNANELKLYKFELESETNDLTDTYYKLLDHVDENDRRIIDSKLERIEHHNLNLMKRFANKIKQLELETNSDVLSVITSKSKASKVRSRRTQSLHSQSSNASTIASEKLAAVTEVATLSAKLKFLDVETEKRLELEKIETVKQLDIANAKLHAISQIELDIDNKNSNKSVNVLLNPSASDFVPRATTLMPFHVDKSKNDRILNENVNKQTLNESVPSSHSNVNDSHISCNSVNEIAKCFAEQMHIQRLPPPEPGIFTGSPLQYPGWKAAYNTLIESKSIPPSEKIHYLKRYLGGEAREAVNGYLLLTTDNAYHKARDILDKRYGDNFTIANAFRDKIDQWPKVASRDGAGLRKLSDFLRQCEAGMEVNVNLSILNDCRENKKILSKLPEWLVHRWTRIVVAYKEKHAIFPPFSHFVDFLECEANIACDPLSTSVIRSSSADKRKCDKQRAESFNVKSQPAKRVCRFCKYPNHHIDDCRHFLALSIENRKEYVKENRLCFSCLDTGHVSKLCKNKRKCKTCGKFHASALHGDVPSSVNPRPTVKTDTKPVDKNVSDQSVSHLASDSVTNTSPTIVATNVTNSSDDNKGDNRVSHLASHGEPNKSSMIVPVWVSNRDKPDHRLLTYALLDTQSDTSFITDHLCDALNATGVQVNLSLSTMFSSNEVVQSKRISGLQVCGYNSDIEITVPIAYTRDIIPANRNHIPTAEMTQNWPHLQGMSSYLMPVSDCEIGMLIGYNCPRALTPREVIPPITDGPYAQKTDLGWGIVGVIDSPLPSDVYDSFQHSIFTTSETSQVVFRITVKEMLKPQTITNILESDLMNVLILMIHVHTMITNSWNS